MFKHPVPEVVERYHAFGSAMFRSDHHGAIEINYLGGKSVIEALSWRSQNKRYWHDHFH